MPNDFKQFLQADMYEQRFSAMMQAALEEAQRAADEEEVPVGAVITDNEGRILAQAHNQTISLADPTAHAEIIALRKAAVRVMNYRLLNTTLYVTLEPCIMCMGAILHARVSRVVFGAKDLRWGGAGTLYDFASDPRLNHHPEIIGGVMAQQAGALIREFFVYRRKSAEINNFG